ncbi:MAG: methionyl-tRNA formyltransferase [Caldisericaceae bacterium]
MRIAFFGSNEFAVPFLKSIANDVVIVVTTVDKIAGRGNRILINPVKAFAMEHSIKFVSVNKFDQAVIDSIKEAKPDIFVVVSFGKIIPASVLGIVSCAVNVHPSKVPLYRGAAPIERQIMEGVTESAVSVIKVSNELDAGDILLSKEFQITPYDTKESVEKRVVEVGVPLLQEAIRLVSHGNCSYKRQEGIPTYAKKISKEDELINWEKDATSICNSIRALYPKPLAYTFLRNRILKIVKAEIIDFDCEAEPGTVCEVSRDFFVVKCGRGAVKVEEVIPEGKKRMLARNFLNGYRLNKGERLGGCN